MFAWSNQEYIRQSISNVGTWSQCYQSFQQIPIPIFNQLPNLYSSDPFSVYHQRLQPNYWTPKHYPAIPRLTNNYRKMEPEKYYQRSRFNDWSVHFSNQMEMPTDEVEKIFSKFGNLKRVSQTGGTRGLCFVNYRDEESAKRCVESLWNHELIKLRLTKDIKKRDAPQNGNGYGKLNNESENKPIDDDMWSNLTKSTTTAKENVEVLDVTKKIEQVNINNTPTIDNLEMDPKVPELVPAKAQTLRSMSTDVATIPALDNKPSMPQISEPNQVISAQEVIVANIPKNFGALFVLHLLEKYRPITISEIKIVPAHSLRYCHVYFMTAKDAKAAENEFDGATLENNNLLVLTTNSLASLAALPA